MKMNCKETKKRWTAQETEYIQQNIGKLSLEAMAAHLNRSPMSVSFMYSESELLQKHLLREIS